MKKVLLTALLSLVASFAFAQGTVNFNNKVSASGVDAPITISGVKIDGTTHANAFAGLYAGPDGATESQLVLIAPIVGFRSGTAAGYVNVGSLGSRAIAAVVPGGFAMVQVRAWDGGSSTYADYASALSGGALTGKSNILRIQTGGAGVPAGPAADLVGLQAFALAVPEPSTVAFVLMGGLGLLAIRRRK